MMEKRVSMLGHVMISHALRESLEFFSFVFIFIYVGMFTVELNVKTLMEGQFAVYVLEDTMETVKDVK